MARIAWGRNKTQLDLNTYPDNPSVPIGSSEWNQDPEDGGLLGFTKQSATVASNTFAPTKPFHVSRSQPSAKAVPLTAWRAATFCRALLSSEFLSCAPLVRSSRAFRSCSFPLRLPSL